MEEVSANGEGERPSLIDGFFPVRTGTPKSRGWVILALVCVAMTVLLLVQILGDGNWILFAFFSASGLWTSVVGIRIIRFGKSRRTRRDFRAR